MKPLEASYHVFTWLCVCPTDGSNELKKFKNYLFTIIAFLVVISALFASLAFILSYLTTDLENSLCAGYQVSGLVSALYTLIMAYTQRNKIIKCFEDFQQFYDSCKSYDLRFITY